jgi:hypothetical protein
MLPTRQVLSVLVLAAVTTAGCSTNGGTSTPGAHPVSGASVDPTPSAVPVGSSTAPTPAAIAATKPRWSSGPRVGGAATPPFPSEGTAAVLRAIRTSHSAAYDRVVFEFTGTAPGYRVEYRPRITEDPSDRTVPLAGHAYLNVALHGATLDNAFQGGHERYSGSTRIPAAYPQLRDVACSGDFEAVLSFGLGVDHRAGFRVLTLSGPTRIVVDVATGA